MLQNTVTFSLLILCNTSPFKTVNKRKDVPSKSLYKLNHNPPRHNEQPVEVLGRYALGVVLPHIYKVFLNCLRTPEKDSRLLIENRSTEYIKELTCKQLVPNYYTDVIFTSASSLINVQLISD